MAKTFLYLGCGPKRKDRTTAGFADWNELRFDIRSVQPDLVGTITDMFSVSSESVDAVFSSHNIPLKHADVVTDFPQVEQFGAHKSALESTSFVLRAAPV
jgi:hypothetical protein